LTTPIATARLGIYTLLNAQFSGTATVHDHFPQDGAEPKSIVIQHVGGVDQILGLHEAYSATKKGILIRTRFQVDVFAENSSDRDSWSDNVIEKLWDNRSTLKNTYGILQHRLVLAMDIPPEPGERNLFRKTLQFDVLINVQND